MELEYARSFFELVVYQKARELQRQIVELSRAFPDAERFAMTDQIRRASRSIGAQIAEAWAKRTYPRHFVSKLTDAHGEAYETQHWLIAAVDAGYLSKDLATPPFQLCNEIGRMITKMIQRRADFCRTAPSTLREDAEDFYTASSVAINPLTSALS